MNELNKHLSKIVSPYDGEDSDQTELTDDATIDFEKDEILDSISEKTSRRTFDLYFDELLQELKDIDKIDFLTKCFEKLIATYAIPVVYDKVQRENLIISNQTIVIDFINFICKDVWLESLMTLIPIISLDIITDKERLYDFLNSNIDTIRSTINKDEQINELIRFELDNASNEECVGFLFKLIYKDIPGVVSVQLVINSKKEIK